MKIRGKNLIPTWRDDAACRDELTELFFPAGETGAHAVQAEAAKAVCARCPVFYTCLKAALDGNESGIWGGMTDRERHNLKNKTKREQYATEGALKELLEVTLPPCENCGQHRKPKADGMCATCVTAAKREAVSA